MAACENAWFHGVFGAPRKPHLVACILPASGAEYVGVFPGRNGQVCTKLNLSVALEPSARVAATAKLHIALDADFRHAACVDEATAKTVVHSELGKLGLAGWRIGEPGPGRPTSTRPCATAIVVLPSTVNLFFVPKVGGVPTVSGKPPLTRV